MYLNVYLRVHMCTVCALRGLNESLQVVVGAGSQTWVLCSKANTLTLRTISPDPLYLDFSHVATLLIHFSAGLFVHGRLIFKAALHI